MDDNKTEALGRIKEVMKHLRYCQVRATGRHPDWYEALPQEGRAPEKEPETKFMLGLLAVDPDGGGRVVSKLEADSFFADICLLLDIPPQTQEDDMEAMAEEMLSKLGLR